MKKLFMRNKGGFTLIELLIVVAIIGILAGIAIPNFLGARTKAKVARAFADMGTIATALESYMLDNGEYPATSGDQINTTELGSAYISSIPKDPFGTDGAVFRYYTTGSPTTAWLLVSNGPDLDGDEVTEWPSDSTYIKSGQLGGPDSVVDTKSDNSSSPWSDGSSGSDGDLGRAGP